VWLVSYDRRARGLSGGRDDGLDYGDIDVATPHEPAAGEGYERAQRFRVD